MYGAYPDPLYIRSGGQEGKPMGCRGTCPLCRPYYEERRRRRSPAALTPVPERDGTRPPKDPRYSWLPP
jgi:hypothetical protein